MQTASNWVPRYCNSLSHCHFTISHFVWLGLVTLIIMFFVCFFVVVFSTSLFLAGNLGHLTRVRTVTTRAALPIAIPVTVCSNNGMPLPVFRIFSFYIQCTDVGTCKGTWGLHRYNYTIRQSALEVDFGRKIPCRTVTSNQCQYCTWLFTISVRHSTNWAVPIPI